MRARVGALLLLSFLCVQCGPGSGSREPAFVVPAAPSFEGQEGSNQAPPEDWLSEVVVPRTPSRPMRLTREESDAAADAALVLARDHHGVRWGE
jgi:hypothetical protein